MRRLSMGWGALCVAAWAAIITPAAAQQKEQMFLTVRAHVEVNAGYNVHHKGPFNTDNIGTLETRGSGHDTLTMDWRGTTRFGVEWIDGVPILDNGTESKATGSVAGGGSRYDIHVYTSNLGGGTRTTDYASSWSYSNGSPQTVRGPYLTSTDGRIYSVFAPHFPLEVKSTGTVDTTEVQTNSPPKKGHQPTAAGPATWGLGQVMARAGKDANYLRHLVVDLGKGGPVSLSGTATFSDEGDLPHLLYVGSPTADGREPEGSHRYTASLRLEWTLGAAPPDAEVVVTPPESLKTWRPFASRDARTPGTRLAFHGEVKPVGEDAAASSTPVTVEFSLLTSAVPGVCNNHPQNPGSHFGDPDLDVDSSGTSPELKVVAREAVEQGDYRHRITLKGSFKVGDRFTLQLGSFDFGAFGELIVDSSVKARIEGYPGLTVALPLDDNHNHVADAWEREHLPPGSGTAANADDDGLPIGAESGDGLGLYEEYRGFFIGGTWMATEPWQKDLFVQSERRGETDPQVDLFSAASGISTHKIAADEMDSGQVINFHSIPGRIADQRAVKVRVLPREALIKLYMDRGGEFDPGLEGFAPPGERFIAVLSGPGVGNVAHELGHVVGMQHHGDGDYRPVACDPKDMDKPACVKITNARIALGERARKMGLAVDDVFVAVQHGEHSGPDPCIMRYVSADFIELADGTFVPYGPAEAPARTFCDAKRGSGVNDAARVPYPKCGDAAHDGCRRQIRVRDRK